MVDNGSGDGTPELVRERFPEARLIEQENRGLGAGWNAGMQRGDEGSGSSSSTPTPGSWATDWPGSSRRSSETPEAAIAGPRLLNQDGTLQRSLRGFPTLWRLATEYFFLRKLGPRTRIFNAFYGAGFRHDRELEAEFLMGAALLVRPQAVSRGRGPRRALLPLQRGGGLVLPIPPGGLEDSLHARRPRSCTSAAPRTAGGSSASRFRGTCSFSKNTAAPRSARAARRLLVAALTLRGLVYSGERGACTVTRRGG